MNNQNNKRSTAGIKALIAAASVAATLAGWSMLPSNDPASAAGTSNPLDQPPALSVPGSDPSQGLDTLPSQPTSPDSQLPQVQAPRGFSRLPFTNTHSSR